MCACEGSYVCPRCQVDDHSERENEPEGPPDDYEDGTWYGKEDADAEEAEHPTLKRVVVDDKVNKDEVERR